MNTYLNPEEISTQYKADKLDVRYKKFIMYMKFTTQEKTLSFFFLLWIMGNSLAIYDFCDYIWLFIYSVAVFLWLLVLVA